MIHTLIRLFIPDTDNLSIRTKLLTVVKAFSVIFIVTLLTSMVTPGFAYPILVASMGASVLIMLAAPNSSLGQPWPFIGGQMLSALVGISCVKTIAYLPLSAAVAVAVSALLMLLLRCLHPPGAATALAPVVGGHAISSLGYDFVLVPVAINVLIIAAMVLVINRWLMGYDYPAMAKPVSKKKLDEQPLKNPAQQIGVTEQDILRMLKQDDTFVPVMTAELSKLLTEAEFYHFKRITGLITCADIMGKDIVWVEYDTEVEDAWHLMLKHNLKALPVLDRARRVIGIVTWHDFFKFVDLNAYENLPQRLKAFIRRTPDVSTDKPEAVGHVMTSAVKVLADDSHIVELIPLMADNGHRQIPIIDQEQRLVGMVYQSQLCAALYNQQLANRS